MKIKTDKELLIELRNKIASRKIELTASAEYWREKAKKAKTNSQDKVTAIQQIRSEEDGAMKDALYLKVIDKMLNEQK